MRRRDIAAALVGAALVLPVIATANLTQDNSGLVVAYQGHLERNGRAFDGSAQFSPRVFKTATTTTSCYSPAPITGTVFAGEFSIAIGPLPPDCLNGTGNALYLEMSVQGPGDTAAITLTGPAPNGRQKVHAVPFAMASAPSSIATILGNIGIGTSNPTAAIHLEKQWGGQASPADGLAYLYNMSTTPDANASLSLRVNGNSAGNPFLSLDVNGESGWTVGIDNADNNRLKLTPSWNGPAAAPFAMALSNAGDVAIARDLAVTRDLGVRDVGARDVNASGLIRGTLEPAWDSGWVNNPGNATTILTHNLGVLPRSISVWYRQSATSTFVQPVNYIYDEANFAVHGPAVGVSTSQLRFRVRWRATAYFNFDENGNYTEAERMGGQYRFVLYR